MQLRERGDAFVVPSWKTMGDSTRAVGPTARAEPLWQSTRLNLYRQGPAKELPGKDDATDDRTPS